MDTSTLSFAASKVSFMYLMAPIDFTNDPYPESCSGLHLHIKDQKTHQR